MHIKIMNVLQFYPTVAIMVKIIERLWEELKTFFVLFLFFITMFTVSLKALDLAFPTYDEDSL